MAWLGLGIQKRMFHGGEGQNQPMEGRNNGTIMSNAKTGDRKVGEGWE